MYSEFGRTNDILIRWIATYRNWKQDTVIPYSQAVRSAQTYISKSSRRDTTSFACKAHVVYFVRTHISWQEVEHAAVGPIERFFQLLLSKWNFFRRNFCSWTEVTFNFVMYVYIFLHAARIWRYTRIFDCNVLFCSFCDDKVWQSRKISGLRFTKTTSAQTTSFRIISRQKIKNFPQFLIPVQQKHLNPSTILYRTPQSSFSITPQPVLAQSFFQSNYTISDSMDWTKLAEPYLSKIKMVYI